MFDEKAIARFVQEVKEKQCRMSLDQLIGRAAHAAYDEIQQFGDTNEWPVVFSLIDNNGQAATLCATAGEDLSAFKVFCTAIVTKVASAQEIANALLQDAQERLDAELSLGTE